LSALSLAGRAQFDRQHCRKHTSLINLLVNQ